MLLLLLVPMMSCAQTLDLVRPGDVLLTYGFDRTAVAACAAAAKKRDAHIFICEASPSLAGHTAAVSARRRGVS